MINENEYINSFEYLKWSFIDAEDAVATRE